MKKSFLTFMVAFSFICLSSFTLQATKSRLAVKDQIDPTTKIASLRPRHQEDTSRLQGHPANAKLATSQVCPESLRTEAKTCEQNGNVLRAAQLMDSVLKRTPQPSLDDLCYAFTLNKRLPFIARQKRAQKLEAHILTRLKLTSDPDNVVFEDSTWSHFRHYLEYQIEQSILDPSYQTRRFCFTVLGEELGTYVEWSETLWNHYGYPIGLSETSEASGLKVNGAYEKYHIEFLVQNYTQREEEARGAVAYHFHGGTLDESRINPKTFYNLMVRAGFTKEDFEATPYGYQDRVLAKPVSLQRGTLDQCAQEAKAMVLSTLQKAEEPYVALVIDLPPSATFTIDELYKNLNRPFLSILPKLATIVETEEKRLYLCFYNKERTTLDLHKLSVAEAFSKVKAFIQEKYKNFVDECLIITGRGNHVNASGTRGVLFQQFKMWVNLPELEPCIQSITPINKNGAYKVTLRKPGELGPKGANLENDVTQVGKTPPQKEAGNRNRSGVNHKKIGPKRIVAR